MTFTGHVVSGIGQGAQFLALDWVAAQLRQHLDLAPFPGTLNLRVSPEIRRSLFDRRQEFLRIADPHSGPASPDCPGYLKEITLRANARMYRPAYFILPEKTIHQDVLELIAAVSLREALALQDGDPVAVDSRLD